MNRGLTYQYLLYKFFRKKQSVALIYNYKDEKFKNYLKSRAMLTRV